MPVLAFVHVRSTFTFLITTSFGTGVFFSHSKRKCAKIEHCKVVVMYPRKKIATAIEFVRLTYNRICTRWRKYVDDSFRNVPYVLGFTSNILFYFTVIIVTEVSIIRKTHVTILNDIQWLGLIMMLTLVRTSD